MVFEGGEEVVRTVLIKLINFKRINQLVQIDRRNKITEFTDLKNLPT